MAVLRHALVLLAAVAALGAGEHRHVHPPAPALGVAGLDACAAGDALHLVTAEVAPGRPARVLHRRSGDGGATWAEPVEIAIGVAPHGQARHAELQLAAQGDQLLAAWSTAGSGFMGGGPIATAISHDGGRSWSRGDNPADDGSDKGHNFIDLAGDGAGRFHAVWLDGRSGKQGLIHAASDGGGRSWSANRILDPRTCECCWNTVVADSSGGVFVLYRRHQPRDLAVIASGDLGASWGEAVPLGGFNWDIDACPHNGGGLALTGMGAFARLHAAVWTGAEGAQGVHHLVSTDRGRTWTPPRAMEVPQARHAAIAALGSTVVVACTGTYDGTPTVVAVTSDDDGHTWGEPKRLSTPGSNAGYPKAVTTAQGIRVFWTERKGADGAWEWRCAAP